MVTLSAAYSLEYKMGKVGTFKTLILTFCI